MVACLVDHGGAPELALVVPLPGAGEHAGLSCCRAWHCVAGASQVCCSCGGRGGGGGGCGGCCCGCSGHGGGGGSGRCCGCGCGGGCCGCSRGTRAT